MVALAAGPLAPRVCDALRAPGDAAEADPLGSAGLDRVLEEVVGLRGALAAGKSWEDMYFSDPPKYAADRYAERPPVPRDLAEAMEAQYISGAALPVQVFVLLVGFTDGRGGHGLRLAKAELKEKLDNREASTPPLISLRQHGDGGWASGDGSVGGGWSGMGGEVHRVAFSYQWNYVSVDAAVMDVLERELRLGMRALDPAGNDPVGMPGMAERMVEYQVDVDRLERVLDHLVEYLGLQHGCTVVVTNPKRFRFGYGFRPGLSRAEMALLRSVWNSRAEPELPEARAFIDAFRAWMKVQKGPEEGGGGNGGVGKDAPPSEDGSPRWFWTRYSYKTSYINVRDLEESSRQWAERRLADIEAEWDVWEAEERAIKVSGPETSAVVKRVRETRFWRHAMELLTVAEKGGYLEAILTAKGEESLPAEACLVSTWVSQQRWVLLDITAGPLKWGPKHRPLDCANTVIDVPSTSELWAVEQDLLPVASEAMTKLEEDIKETAVVRREEQKAKEAEEKAARESEPQANGAESNDTTYDYHAYDYHYDYGGGSWGELAAERKNELLVRLEKYRELAASTCRTPEEQRSAVCVALADRIHHTEQSEGEDYVLKQILLEARNVTDEKGKSFVAESLLEAIFGEDSEASAMLPHGVNEFILSLRSAVARAVHSAAVPPLVRSTGIGASSRHDRDVVFHVHIVHEGSQTMSRWDHGRGKDSGFSLDDFKSQMLKLEPPSANFLFEVSHVNMWSNKHLANAFKSSLRENLAHSHGPLGHVHSLVDAVALGQEISNNPRGWDLTRWFASGNGRSQPLHVPVYVFDLDATDGPILFKGDVQAVALPDMVLALQSTPMQGKEAEFAHALQDWPAMDVHCGSQPLGFDASSVLAATLAACAEWVAGLSRAPLRSVQGLSNEEGSFADAYTGEAWREDWLWAVGEGPLSATGGASAGFLLRAGVKSPASFSTLSVDQAHRGRVAIEGDRLINRYNRAVAILRGTSTAGLGRHGDRSSAMGWFDSEIRDILTAGDRDQVHATTERRSYRDQLQKDRKSVEQGWKAVALAVGRLEWDKAFDELDRLETVVNRFAATAQEAAAVCLRRRNAPFMPDAHRARSSGLLSDRGDSLHAAFFVAVVGFALWLMRSQTQLKRRQRLGFLLDAKDKAS